MNADRVIADLVRSRKIPIFGIADAEGFEHALPGWHPKELMPTCRSVIVAGHPLIKHAFTVDQKTHVANDSWWEANQTVRANLAAWRGDIMQGLDALGIGTANFGGYAYTTEPTFSYRLAQHEAGVGVYGRFGVCLNPQFGCRYVVAVLLTEAELTPTSRDRLQGFNPCLGCSKCAEVCPVKAIDGSSAPTECYDREKCARFILKLKQRHGLEVKICSHCFGVCPWGPAQDPRHVLP